MALAYAAALVIRESLVPVEGGDGVLFPATFAAGDNFPGGYNRIVCALTAWWVPFHE